MISKEENKQDYLVFIEYLKTNNLIDNRHTLDYWSNSPIDFSHLLPLYTIYQPGYKFLDLGAGCGNILRFAKNIGYDVYGVEFNTDYIPYLQEYNHRQADILTLNNNFYQEFDVIYSYRPLKDGFEAYIDKVIDNMKNKSYIVTPSYEIPELSKKHLQSLRLINTYRRVLPYLLVTT